MNISEKNSRATTLRFSENRIDAQDSGLISKIIQSESFVIAKRRVFCQLLQALIYEQTVQASKRKIDQDCVEFAILGADTFGNKVVYTCRGVYRPSFGRIRLTKAPLLRTIEGDTSEADSVSRFLQEIKPSYACEPEFLQRFCHELEHTQLNHAMSLFYLQGVSTNLRDQRYDDIETGLNDAHPYHPCFKSRIGFDIGDNIAFGPEYGPPVRLLWLAVRKSASIAVVSHKKELSVFLAQELGVPLIKQFQKVVEDLGERFDHYTFLPVHPWQWQKVIIPECLLDLRNNDIIYLGIGDDLYHPQQSIRTLSNETNRSKAYVKLALSILNTSTMRGLAEHTVRNAPIISDWLQRIADEDPFISGELKLVLLGEVAAVSYQPSARHATTGSLACLWRESVHNYLAKGEQAIPFSALTTVDRDGVPVIEAWVAKPGVKQWLQQFLEVSVTPLIHMLYAHGIALESHAQNTVLITQCGRPKRVALKDFHDGIRFMRKEVSLVSYAKKLTETPTQHLQNNSTSYIEATTQDDVRDFLYSAFFSMNLSELALFLAEHFSLPEEQFWCMTAECIEAYQTRFPELKERFNMFDLFEDTVAVEAHTKRRLLSENTQRINRVKNPLIQFRKRS